MSDKQPYQFAGEDDHMFHVKHPDGSTFGIAKSAVGPGVHKMIKGLEPVKMADGGEVPEPDFQQIQIDAPDAVPAPDSSINQNGLKIDAASDVDTAQPAPVNNLIVDRVPDNTLPQNSLDSAQRNPAADQSANTAADMTPQEIAQGSGVSASKNNAYDAQEKAIKESSAVQQNSFQQQQKTYEKLAQDEANINAELTKKTAPIEAQNQALNKAIMDGKIDHNRLYSNMNTGNKVLAGISILLSGIGSGMTGKSNMAMDVIQKSIDRDIEDQKLDLGKKQTLFSENLRQLGDARSAALATKAQMASAVQAKVASYAAQSGSAQAMLNSKIMLSNIDLEKQKLNREVGLRQIGMNGGNIDPALLVPHLVPEARQPEVFKEIKDAQNIKRGSTEVLEAFDKADKEQSLFSKNAAPGVNSPYIGKLKAAALPQFQNIDGTVRQAAMDAFLPTVTPAVGDTKHTIAVKRDTLKDWIVAHSSAPTAKGYGIDLDKFGSTTTQQAPPTKTVNGITYMRGPNGQAIPVK